MLSCNKHYLHRTMTSDGPPLRARNRMDAPGEPDPVQPHRSPREEDFRWWSVRQAKRNAVNATTASATVSCHAMPAR
jgi:hypothetical protein